MKTIYTILIALLLSNITIAQESSKTVSTGASYANDIYYNLSNGEVKSSPRSEWDIAFITNAMDVNILTNGGSGIELYTYPLANYANGWSTTLDITDIANWKKMYNSIEDGSEGAFLKNQLGHPDYGWGIYNPNSHDVIGDSIFIIKLADASYKKLAIVSKLASNTWNFKYADLDGQNEEIVSIVNSNYTSKNFIHYSIANKAIVSHEPDKNTWDLLFTKYYDYTIPYSVTGVLTRNGLTVQEVSDVDQATFVDYNAEQFTEVISTIGSDWKSFNMNTMSYDVVNNKVFFIKEPDATNAAGDVWKLYFTGFTGSSTGEYHFELQNLTTTNIDDTEAFSTVYPNPAQESINVIYDLKGSCDISIFNMNGQLVYNQKANQTSELNKLQININDLPSGLYNLTIKNDSKISYTKFIKQ